MPQHPLANPGVDDGHSLGVWGLEVPLHLPNAVRVSRLVLVDPLDVQASVPLEVAHGELQYVGLFQFRMFRVVRLRRIQDEGLEGGEALVDAGASSLLHEWFVGSSWF